MQSPKSKIQNLKSVGSRGITLIELLVAMTILLMITAITLPVIAPNLATRRIREAARSVDVYLGVARNRAMEIGRPVGVMLAPVQIGSTSLPAATTLFQVEIPPPYCGDSLTSAAQWHSGTGPWTWTMVDTSSVTSSGTFTSTGFTSTNNVHVNDRVRLNHQGPLYLVTAFTASTITLQLAIQTSLAGYQVPWTATSTTPVPYEVFPQPIRSATPPLQLPAGAIVDLQYSGIDTSSATTTTMMNNWPYWFATMAAINYYSTNTPYPVGVMIVFLPSGAVEGLYLPTEAQSSAVSQSVNGYSNPLNVPYPFRPTSMIYLNVGKFERLDRTIGSKPNAAPSVAAANQWANDGLYNWQDPDCLWVTINPLNGYVTTKENAAIPRWYLSSSNAWTNATNLYVSASGGLVASANGTTPLAVNGAIASRWIARQAQQVSGR